jgi:hypothetical protein
MHAWRSVPPVCRDEATAPTKNESLVAEFGRLLSDRVSSASGTIVNFSIASTCFSFYRKKLKDSH